MKLYTCSPVKNKAQLIEAIKFTHFACYKLCHQVLGEYLPVAGNVGIFCHYDDEYELLTKLREELTAASDNFNQKYFRLHEPIVIPAKSDMPETTYLYLYIRKPDPYRHQVGDVDFVLDKERYENLKKSLIDGKLIKGIRVFDRPEDDMLELLDPDIDALGYVVTEKMEDKINSN